MLFHQEASRSLSFSPPEYVISSVSYFIAASQGPDFRHFSPGPSMLCAAILLCIYFPGASEREKETEKSDDSLTLVVRTLTVPGNFRWNGGRWLLTHLGNDDDRPILRGGGKKSAHIIPECSGIQPDVWRSLPGVRMSRLEDAHFVPFLPTSNPCRMTRSARRQWTS